MIRESARVEWGEARERAHRGIADSAADRIEHAIQDPRRWNSFYGASFEMTLLVSLDFGRPFPTTQLTMPNAKALTGLPGWLVSCRFRFSTRAIHPSGGSLPKMQEDSQRERVPSPRRL